MPGPSPAVLQSLLDGKAKSRSLQPTHKEPMVERLRLHHGAFNRQNKIKLNNYYLIIIIIIINKNKIKKERIEIWLADEISVKLNS